MRLSPTTSRRSDHIRQTTPCWLLIDQRGSPIDYQRRRARVGTDLVTRQQWAQLCLTTPDNDAVTTDKIDGNLQ